MYVEANVGIADTDIRPCSGLFAKLVNNGILYFIGDKARVAKLFGVDNRVYTEGFSFLNILAPVYFFDLIVHIFCRASLEVSYRFEDSDGRMQLEIGSIQHLLITCKRHHSTACLYIVGTQLGELLSQNGFKSHESLGYEFKFLFHCCIEYLLYLS